MPLHRLLPSLLLAACAPGPSAPPRMAQPPGLFAQRLSPQLPGSAAENPRVSWMHLLVDGAVVAPGMPRHAELTVPTGAARLGFAYAVLDPGEDPRACLEGHGFEVTVTPAGGEPRPLLRTLVERPDRVEQWYWAQAQLAAWEGQQVELRFALEGPAADDPACRGFRGAFGDVQVTAWSGPEPQPTERPDILLAVVDTLRGDHVGYVEGASVRTPNMVAWADEGAWFDDALAPSSWTRESMASILTGTYLSVDDVRPDGLGVRFPTSVPTVAELLQAQGYRTIALVANPTLEPPATFERGFDVFQAVSDANMPQALEAVLNGSDPRQPLFVWVQLMAPHLDYCYRGEHSAPHFEEIGLPDNPFWCLKVERDPATWTPELRARTHAYYRGEVEFADHIAGRLFDLMRERAQRGDPWLLLSSDHGEELWDHGGYEHGHSLLQEVVRVPLLLRPPAGWADAGSLGRRGDPVSPIDLAHTIVDIAGLGPLDRPAGLSLLPLLRGERLPRTRVRLSAGTIYGSALVATLVEGSKTIWDLGRGGEAFVAHRYDLAGDPSEREPTQLVSGALEGSSWAAFQQLAMGARGTLRVAMAPTGGGPLELKLALPGDARVLRVEPAGTSVKLERSGDEHRLSVSTAQPATLWLQLEGLRERHGFVELQSTASARIAWPEGSEVQGGEVRIPLPWRLYRPGAAVEPLEDGLAARVSWVFEGSGGAGAHPDPTPALRELGYLD
jgi:choline-sulfatase